MTLALSFLVDSRRIVRTHTLGALSSCPFYLCKKIPNLATAAFELTDQH